MTHDDIERLAVEHEAFGFGNVGEDGLTVHGFEPEGLAAFVAALRAQVLEELELWQLVGEAELVRVYPVEGEVNRVRVKGPRLVYSPRHQEHSAALRGNAPAAPASGSGVL